MQFCVHDVHPLRSFSSSFRVKTGRWGRERAEMRDTRSVESGERESAQPPSRDDLLVRNAPPRSLTSIRYISLQEMPSYQGRTRGCSTVKCIFWPFFSHFGRFGPAWRPLTGQHGRFSDTSQANPGTVVAFLSVPEGLNHLGSP